jgi:sodium/potassium-transporting ATPase subunit alpha
MGTIFFVYGVISGRSLWVNLVFMMGIIVANVPEGLLPTLTLSLSLASQRMARRQVLVKGLEAVEAMGAMHVICTDKTGTLTKNELAIARVVDAVLGDDLVDGFASRSVLQSALIASHIRGNNQRFSGDPLDVCVAEKYAQMFGVPAKIIAETRRHFPFDLERRREAGVFDDGQIVLFAVKGAWESLRPFIGQIDQPHAKSPLPANDDALKTCDAIVHSMSSQGQRVIAVACRRLQSLPRPDAAEESLERHLVLKGFLALDDPIRDDVPSAVASSRTAGIRVILVTGDHPDTAEAVARQCGILNAQDTSEGRILLGSDLASITDDELIERLRASATVFARTTPEQKMKIVAALKRLGYVVGMTGDGVNDAPALKAADVGIAMGIGGTDVARESADVVLLDNSFSSIVAGVEEGRAVFSNIQKFTTYVLASNIPEIVPYLLYIMLPVPLALTIIQILSIDLGTDFLPAIGLGQEPPEPDTLKQPPRRSDERLLSFRVMAAAYLFLGVIQAAFSLALFFVVLHQGGWKWGQELGPRDPLYRSATGITLASVILMQIGNLVGRRSIRQSGLDTGLLRNRLMLAGIALEIAFSWAILYYPPVQVILATGPVSPILFACAWLGIPLLFGLDLLRKRVLSRSSSLVAPQTTSSATIKPSYRRRQSLTTQR